MSKTTKYYVQPKKASDFVGNSRGGKSISPIVGKPLYSIISYKWGGLDDNGNPQGYLNGKLSTDYKQIFSSSGNFKDTTNIIYNGPAIPPFFGALSNTFIWRGFSITANITYKFGYYFQRSAISYDALYNQGRGHEDYSKRWQRPGDEKITNVPAMIYPNNENRDRFYLQSEANVERGDHIDLQFINLSYKIDKLKLEKLSVKSLNLYINASNLGILWRSNKDGINPDHPSSIPAPKTYAVGIRASF